MSRPQKVHALRADSEQDQCAQRLILLALEVIATGSNLGSTELFGFV